MVDSENANQPFNKTVTCYDTLHCMRSKFLRFLNLSRTSSLNSSFFLLFFFIFQKYRSRIEYSLFPPRLGNLTKLQSKSFRVEIMQDASRRACLKQRRCITLQAEGNNDGVVYCAPVR